MVIVVKVLLVIQVSVDFLVIAAIAEVVYQVILDIVALAFLVFLDIAVVALADILVIQESADFQDLVATQVLAVTQDILVADYLVSQVTQVAD